MTPQEYVNATDRVKVTCAIKILGDIIPENSRVINMHNYIKVMQMLGEWEEKLFEISKTSGE